MNMCVVKLQTLSHCVTVFPHQLNIFCKKMVPSLNFEEGEKLAKPTN